MINRNLHGYILVELLGSGGMGTVYKAVHHATGKTVAIKILNQKAEITRFKHEAYIQSRIVHPNIVSFIDFVESTEQSFIIMEYIEGLNLERLIKHLSKLPEKFALKLFAQMIDAVSFLHQNKIIHRDLKSANIKVSKRSEVKILDFGIAKSSHSQNLTAEGLVIGSTPYLAPEQFKHILAPSVDCWALGVIFYEMMCGYLPFTGASEAEIRTNIQKSKYLDPRIFAESISHNSSKIIKNLLVADPAKRWNIQQVRAKLKNRKHSGITRVTQELSSFFRKK